MEPDEELLRRFGLRRLRSIPEPVYDCEKCRDTGMVITLSREHNGAARRCDCWKNPSDAKVDQRLAEIGMRTAEVDGSKSPWRSVVDGVEVDAWPQEAAGWLESIKLPKPRLPVLLLYGPPGRGKSKLAAMLCRSWVKENFLRRAMWAYWSAALRIDRRDPESDIEEQMCTADLLALDDATKGLSGYGLDVLERVVDERQGEYRPTIVTMNLQPGMAGADEVLRATLASRLQRAVIVEFCGQLDIRGAI